MSKFKFCYFTDCEDGKMARVETPEYELPVNVFIDNAAEFDGVKEGPCEIEVCGVSGDFEIYASEQAYKSANCNMSAVSMIPMGTFSADEAAGDFEESPNVLFSGRVLKVERDEDADGDDPNCRLRIETFDLTFDLYLRYDGAVEAGYIVHGVAWLFGDLKMQSE